ncbi:cyclic lactone autoinducer peptide [Paenibacillus tritici]|uniref:Cyclic lactone autoinducer peptide n=1 Tax=Paenibacillus tritici TaxID=1873425 RepID=A0ABX2DGN4_9BACL|nr:cyclic lactone autoinducer peptide [Paenibacillus tritici]NQX43783.1 cyclic lactone autoinducer peptide [Paenibacillus tritici]
MRKNKWNLLSSALAFLAVITVTPASVFFVYGAEAPEELLK